MLLHFGIIPYIVFDGDYLPSKAKTEVERAKKRKESKQRGLELYRMNKPSQAHLELQKAVDVTPEMARQFIDELKKIEVAYVVAPYEADAQMVYMEKQGIIDGILSEDSDLLVFGAKRLLTKLDQFGDCIEVNRADFTSCREISLVGWTDADFRRMAILSGCDYLASINRMGLKTAYRLVRKHKSIEKVVRALQFDGQYHVPAGYLEAFHKAELTFLHQRVYCPAAEEVVMMIEPEEHLESQDLSFVGDQVEKHIAMAVAKGDLDPMTKAPIRVRKSHISTPPRTPRTAARKSIVGENISDMKGHQSIESFFKSKRTPLAELDVNTFTPSPSQAHVLRQNERAQWDAVSAVSQPSSVDVPTPVAGSLRTPLSDRGTNLSNISTTKKRKLVNNKDILLNADDTLGTSSKFFTATTPESQAPRGRTKARKKTTDFTVWSDDSVENAMIELAADTGASDLPADPTTDDAVKLGSPKDGFSAEEIRPEAQIHEDLPSKHSSAAYTQSETQTSITTDSSLSTSQAAASADHDDPNVNLKGHSKHEPTKVDGISRFLNNNNTKTEVGAEPMNDRSRPALPKQKTLSALQRLGMHALGRSKSCAALSSGTFPRVDNFDNLLRSSSRGKAVESTQRQPSMPLAHTFGPDASMAKGSEDALIPSSEGEGSDVVSEEDEGTTRPAIHFGRFAYSG